MQLFRAETINQYKIGQWLIEQGIKPEEVASVVFPTPNSVKIVAPWGAYMTVLWEDGKAVIDQSESENALSKNEPSYKKEYE